MLSTTRLQILREVATRGTAAGAAKALFLTPPAVTYQLAALEREVGVPLLNRTGRSVQLTAAGMRLVQHADTILANCELALADVRAFTDDVRGTVRLSVFRAAPGGVTLAALLALGREYPNLEILTSDQDPEQAVTALKAGQLDIALSYEWGLTPRPRNVGIDRHALFTEPMVLLLPRDREQEIPLSIQDCAHASWCVAQDEEHGRRAIEHVARHYGFEPKVVFESDNFRAIGSAVEAGLGVGLVPLMTDLRGLDVVIQPLTEPRMSRRVFAAVRPGSCGSPAIHAVLEALAAPACSIRTSTMCEAVKHAVMDSDDMLGALRNPSAETQDSDPAPTSAEPVS